MTVNERVSEVKRSEALACPVCNQPMAFQLPGAEIRQTLPDGQMSARWQAFPRFRWRPGLCGAVTGAFGTT